MADPQWVKMARLTPVRLAPVQLLDDTGMTNQYRSPMSHEGPCQSGAIADIDVHILERSFGKAGEVRTGWATAIAP
jgi:hypothetical protein